MKKSFSSRRVPRKIGRDDEPDEVEDGREENSEPTIKRPTIKPRKGSSLRKIGGPSALEDEESAGSGVVTPKRSNLSRIAIQRNAAKKSYLSTASIPARESDDDDGPSYSAASLQALKDSTPATPKEMTVDLEQVSKETQALDLSSKFGTSLSSYQQPSAIPSAAEIAEKKARRARLAKEEAAEEFISLDPSDPELDEDLDENVMRDDSGRLVLKPKDKYGQAESRLERDDEDIMENFDEFTEADGKILLGRKAEAEAARKRKQDMAAQIAEAEGASENESDDSDRQRNEAFEAAQTKHGTYGAREDERRNDNGRPKTPPIITPLPTLGGVIDRLRSQVVELQTTRMQKLREMEALQREKIRLGEEEVRIQKALRETAEKFAQLRAEKGIEAPAANERTPALLNAPPVLDPTANGDGDMERYDDEGTEGASTGLGFGHPGLGLGATPDA